MSLLPPGISICSLSIRRPSTVIHIYIRLSYTIHTYRLLVNADFPSLCSRKHFHEALRPNFTCPPRLLRLVTRSHLDSLLRPLPERPDPP